MPAQRERNRARTCIKSRSGAKPVPAARASSPVTSTKNEGIHKSECLFSCLHEKAKQGTGRKRGRLRGNPEGRSALPGAHVAVSKEEKGSFPSPLLTRQRVRPAKPNGLRGSPANALFSCRSLVLLSHAGMRKGTHFCECLRSWWKLQGSKPAPQARASPRFAILCRFEPCSVLSAQA